VRRILPLLLGLCAAAALGQEDPVSRSWNQPVEPFRIIANVYYVGASNVASYLIATPKGHIVLGGGFKETAPMILDNVQKLGFDPADIRLLLSSHAQFDQAGGLAGLKQKTGARLMATEGDAPLLARGGKDDPQLGNSFLFPPVIPDELLHDNDRVALGGSILTAHLTPGHTPGGTTWTMTVRERNRPYHLVFVGSSSVPPQYKLVGNDRYPNAVDDYRKAFAVLKSLPCDVFLGAHGDFFDLAGKAARLAKRERPNPFIDPAGYKKFVAEREAAFEERLKKETAAPASRQ
jgi:metallo-beta-lactamase class B